MIKSTAVLKKVEGKGINSRIVTPIGNLQKRIKENNKEKDRLTFSITLPLYNGTHEDFDGTNICKRDFALSGGLIKTEMMPELLLADGTWCINLVSENKEGDL